MAFLGDKAVGDVVKINENGKAANYIIVQKGRPSTMYDYSCDGVWLLRQNIDFSLAWDGTSSSYENDYENSDIRAWLNDGFLNIIDLDIRNSIKTVKIPFKKGIGTASTGVQSGSSGLSCKVFLLSIYEIGLTKSDYVKISDIYIDGSKLSYFSDDASRICRYSSTGTAASWWLRSPMSVPKDGSTALYVGKCHPTGGSTFGCSFSMDGIRPAFVLPTDLVVDSNGFVSTNSLPTITSDKTGDLGTLTNGFTCRYSVNDDDAEDSLTVTLMLDSTTLETFAATKGTEYTFSLLGEDWLKIANGSHTFKISVTDGKDTVTSTAAFTRACKKAAITLKSALAADDIIRFCSLKIKGAVPMDTILKCEVTNNANDTSPVWEDCTARVKSESTYVFKNKEAANGFAFNFRISAERGASGVGGYITTVCGGFE